MSDMRVKICGVRSAQIARTVAESGADLMGLIFAPSRRRVTVSQAREILSGLDDTSGSRPAVVGVFVNETPERINVVAEQCQLDYVQLSGDEPVEVQNVVTRPTIRALRLPQETSYDDACRTAERFLDCAAPAWMLLVDTYVPGAYGGTGIPGDWELAGQLAERYPIVLAGGLRPETVIRAVETIRPFGVDVSSGVETNGDKDPAKIRAFVAAAKRKIPASADRSVIRDNVRT